MNEAETAARDFGWVGAPSLRKIAERENVVFDIVLPSGRCALRLHRVGYQSRAAIHSELWWCNALAGAGLAVPSAIPALDGALVVQTASGRHASVVSWLNGAPMGAGGAPLAGSRDAQLQLFDALGALLARMHIASDGLSLPSGFTRPHWHLDGFLGEAPLWGRFWEHPALTPDEAETLRAARTELAAWLAHTPCAADTGLIHADVLRENVLVTAHGPALIDFDDAGFGPRAYDLGTALAQSLREPHLPLLASALARGYARYRPIDPASLPRMTLLRCCASVGWTAPRLAPGDPTHRSHIDRAVRLARHVLSGQADWPAPA